MLIIIVIGIVSVTAADQNMVKLTYLKEKKDLSLVSFQPTRIYRHRGRFIATWKKTRLGSFAVRFMLAWTCYSMIKTRAVCVCFPINLILHQFWFHLHIILIASSLCILLFREDFLRIFPLLHFYFSILDERLRFFVRISFSSSPFMFDVMLL